MDDSNDLSLTGFLFGNITKEGELENKDMFDEFASHQHLAGLSALGIGSLAEDLLNDDSQESNKSSADSSNDDEDVSIPAVDYSDINELADDESNTLQESDFQRSFSNVYSRPGFSSSDDEDEDYDKPAPSKPQSRLMPPPSWIPPQSPAKQVLSPTLSSAQVPKSMAQQTEKDKNKPLKSSLANLIPKELANTDVRKWFPDFRSGKVLRFSRLFKPAHKFNAYPRKKMKSEMEAANEPTEPKAADGTVSVKIEDDGAEKFTSVSVKIEGGGAEKVEPEIGPVTEEPDDEDDDDYYDIVEVPFTLDDESPDPPTEEESDDLARFLRPDTDTDSQVPEQQEIQSKVADWRYGPAQLWYDSMGVDETGEAFDYGFKLKEPANDKDGDVNVEEYGAKVDLPDEAYLMMMQRRWEDDIIFDGEVVRHQVMEQSKKRGQYAGWIPSTNCRTMTQYWLNTYGRPPPFIQCMKTPMGLSIMGPESEAKVNLDKWTTIFPIDNQDLTYKRWEDDIIFDAQAMTKIPCPPVLTLDPNDENIILDVPDDSLNDEDKNEEAASQKEKKEMKKSRILLGKAGILQKEDEEEKEDEPETIENKDPFNLSNDEYYNPKLATDSALKTNLGGTIVQHSTLAVELRRPYFLTHMGPVKLRNFHRPPLKLKVLGHGSVTGLQPVLSLEKTIKKKAKIRDQERLAGGGGDMFFMRTFDDLTGKDDQLVLAEYSEEYPPLMMQIGMATRIKNFYKRKPGKDTDIPTFKYGEIAFAHTSPFLGSMAPGECIQSFENNMFRAPVFLHTMPCTDFLVIRNRHQFFIRQVRDIFSIGQECPLIEVPSPNSKKGNNFVRDFLQVFIYRLFMMNKDDPKRIKMEEIKKAFPTHSESSIRKRLKLCADFKRTGTDSNWWVVKKDFRLPTEEELRAMVVPEQCCAYYSMLAAELRLKDAGYGEKSIFAIEDGKDDDNNEVKMDDEVLAAPWNTTRAYIQAMKAKCLLQLTGVADPTGCGEGFSYVKVPNKPTQSKDEQSVAPVKRTVTGTDADLRRLSLKDARAMLRKFGVPDNEIKKLSRWEVIDCVRTMSTQQAKAGQEGLIKFARGNRYSAAEHQERYKEECQRIFDLQNRILGSSEVLSTDDEDSDDEDSDIEEMGKNIENMLASKKSSSQLYYEKEEEERRELQKMIREGESKFKKDEVKKQEQSIPGGVRKLKIIRTFLNEDGQEYTRTEVVRKPAIIDLYTKIRQTKDEAWIRQFAACDQNKKEEMKKERRRLQEQLRRIKKNQEKVGKPFLSPTKERKRKKKDLQLKETNRVCGACGQVGHMRTNKECPLYTKTEEELNYQKRGRKPLHLPSVQVALTEEQEEALAKTSGLQDKELVHIEGTKMKLSKELVAHTDRLKKEVMKIKIPKKIPDHRKPHLHGKRASGLHYDYLTKPNRLTQRRRADPMVTLSSIFENIVNEMRDVSSATTPFQQPVNVKKVPDYYNIIDTPMDLQTIKQNIRSKKYETREGFLMDVTLIVRNSEKYNGPQTVLTDVARTMLEICVQRLAEKEEKLMKLEKVINPLLDDDELVGFSFILEQVVEKMKKFDQPQFFQKPVNRKLLKDYYEKVERPMCIEQIEKNLKDRRYKTVQDFKNDVNQLLVNSEIYNGPNNSITHLAAQIVKIAETELEQQMPTLTGYEASIRAAQQAALDAADSESVLTGTSLGTEQDGDQPPPTKMRKVGRPRKYNTIPKIKLSKKALAGKAKRGRKPKKIKGIVRRPAHVAAEAVFKSSQDEIVDIEGCEDAQEAFGYDAFSFQASEMHEESVLTGQDSEYGEYGESSQMTADDYNDDDDVEHSSMARDLDVSMSDEGEDALQDDLRLSESDDSDNDLVDV